MFVDAPSDDVVAPPPAPVPGPAPYQAGAMPMVTMPAEGIGCPPEEEGVGAAAETQLPGWAKVLGALGLWALWRYFK